MAKDNGADEHDFHSLNIATVLDIFSKSKFRVFTLTNIIFSWSEMAAVSVPDGIIFMGGSFEESGESVGSTVYMYKDDKWYNDLGALRKPFRHGFAIRNPSSGDIAVLGGTQTTFWHRRWRDGRIHIEKRFDFIKIYYFL